MRSSLFMFIAAPSFQSEISLVRRSASSGAPSHLNAYHLQTTFGGRKGRSEADLHCDSRFGTVTQGAGRGSGRPPIFLRKGP